MSCCRAPTEPAFRLELGRDEDGRPVDVLHMYRYAPREDSELVEKAIWAALGIEGGTRETLGTPSGGERSEPPTITQLLLLYHLFEHARSDSAILTSCGRHSPTRRSS